MAFQLSDYLRYVRNQHPAFEPRLLPDKVLADFASLDQREVFVTALQRDRQFLAQSMPIGFDTANWGVDTPGTAGVGTTGGVPAESDGHGNYQYVQATTGSAIEVQTSDVVILVNDTVVVSATGTMLTGLGVSWTTNAYHGRTVIIVAGMGEGQPPREIASNTTTGLTVTDAWAVTPNGTSVFRIVQSVTLLDQTFGVVTDLPSMTQQQGYLVKLNAQGVPYIDYTTPIIATLSRGIPLPSLQSVLSGTVHFTNTVQSSPAPFTLLPFPDRFAPKASYAGYLLGNQLYLIGDRCDWQNVESIELTYTPILPVFTSRTDYCLLPDIALPWLVARGALFGAKRLQGYPNIPPVPLDVMVAAEADAKRQFLGALGLTVTARRFRMRAGRY